jgi:hypothetical protein
MPEAEIFELPYSASPVSMGGTEMGQEVCLIHVTVLGQGQIKLDQERLEGRLHLVDREAELGRDHPIGRAFRNELEDRDFEICQPWIRAICSSFIHPFTVCLADTGLRAGSGKRPVVPRLGRA